MSGKEWLIERAVPALGLVLAGWVWWVHRDDLVQATFFAVVVAVSGWLSAIDFREHRLPNKITLPLAGFVAIMIPIFGLMEDDMGRAGRALLLGLASFAVLFVFGMLGAMGMGDVKYAFPAATTLAWFGWDTLAQGAIIVVFSAGLVAAILLAKHRKNLAVAYGPYMALGLSVGLLLA